MKIRSLLYTFVTTLSATAALAQPTITSCEHFSIGTVLKFQPCDPGIFAGPGGAATTWDFSALTLLPDTNTEWIIAPSATTMGSLFPGTNMIEKYSDGSFVFATTNADSSLLSGYVDTVNNYVIHYPNPSLFALRPISYGADVIDTFTTTFASASVNFSGKGVSTILADGYGTLKLPNSTYTNTLRLKITQVQSDTLTPSGSVSVTTSINYVWFDNSHTSALLKIDSTQTTGINTKTVEYLISQSTTVPQIPTEPAFSFYPNPTTGVLHIGPGYRGSASVINNMGQVLFTKQLNGQATTIATDQLPAGLYYLVYKADSGIQTFRFTQL